ncbi:MAG: ABC transporter ATP-binding protein [Desulfopila sp.]|nr:ABC transporter ATP-binding protein [Desulfopila sp.]
MILFEAKEVGKTYDDGTKKIDVLKGVNITISPGEMTAIMGASGSGKTTLLQVCGTLSQPSSGDILFEESSLLSKSATELAEFRNSKLGFIFQFHHLLPEFTALENVMMPALIAGYRKKQIHDKALGLLKQVELDHRIHHRINTLSGGEQQRTALARSLIMQPKLLLADEPTGNLDSRSGEIVFNLLQGLCRERSLAVIMVTHNTALAAKMDSVHTLKDGVLFQSREYKHYSENY